MRGLHHHPRRSTPPTTPIPGIAGIAGIPSTDDSGDFDTSIVGSINRMFENDFWGTPMADEDSHRSYRPLTVLSFAINYRANVFLGLPGLHPFGFHAVNLLIHIAVVCTLHATLLRLLGEGEEEKEEGVFEHHVHSVVGVLQ